MSQSRTPKGVPTGGEFASNAHDEAKHWLAERPIPPEPTIPNTTSAIRRDGTAVLMLPGSGRKIEVDLGASPYCESSGIYSNNTGVIRLRYGVESERVPSAIPAQNVTSINDVRGKVSAMLEEGIEPERIYVAAKTNHNFYLVRMDEAYADTFDYGGYVVEADSPDNAVSMLRDYRAWTEERHFDVFERTVDLNGNMGEPEIVVEYADGNQSRQRASFHDED